MIRSGLRIACLLAFFLTAVRAAEAVDDGKLLDQLRSDDFDARVKAQAKLIERGMDARARIDAELERKDLEPDYRDALRAIRAKLKNDEVLKEFDHPKRADFAFANVKVREVIEGLNTEFSSTIRMREESDRAITLQLKQATLAEAVEALRAAGHLAYALDDGIEPTSFLLRENAPAAVFPAMAKGPLIVVISDIAVERRLSFTEEAPKPGVAERQVSLTGLALIQPGTHFSGMEISGVQLKPKTGDALIFTESDVIPDPFQREPGGVDAEMWSRQTFSATLESAPDVSGALAFSGTVKVTIPIRKTEMALTELTEKVGKAQDVMGGTFTIQKLAPEQNGWRMQFKVNEALANSSLGRAMNWSLEGDAGGHANGDAMVLLNAAGKPIAQVQGDDAPEHEQYSTVLQLNEKPAKIVFRKVIESATREFEIKIADVPAP